MIKTTNLNKALNIVLLLFGIRVRVGYFSNKITYN